MGLSPLFLLAAEPSGDVLAASLIKELAGGDACGNKNRRFIGLGGSNCREAGLKSAFDYRELHLMGFWGVLRRLPWIYRRMNQLLALAERSRPAAVITVDSPDFSLRFAKRLRRRLPKTPFIHLVAPSVWAWRPSRAAAMAKTYDHLLCLLPFEPKLFTKHGLKATFVGHPIVENARIKRVSKQKVKSSLRIAVLPGSRAKEIRTHFLFMGRVLAKLGAVAKLKPMVVLAPDITIAEAEKTAFAEAVTRHRGGCHKPQYITWDKRRSAFGRADLAIATSGTVSLELAAAAVPSLIIYRLPYLLELLLRRLIRVPFASIVNILAKRMLMSELIGVSCREKAAAEELTRLYKRGGRQQKAVAKVLRGLKAPKGVSPAGVVKSYL